MRALVVILSHEPPEKAAETLRLWRDAGVEVNDLLLVYGGAEKAFEKIAHSKKAFVEDPSLRCVNPRKDLQSYTEVFRHISGNLDGYTHVLFVEYDLHPLVAFDLILKCYGDWLKSEEADVLCRLVFEVQNSCQAMFLQHRDIPGFNELWQRVSVRKDPEVVLWALLPGSFWTESCVRAVASREESPRQFFEIYLPTLAHHLGYRVRPMEDERMVIFGGGNLRGRLARLRQQGSLVAHPVK